MNPCTWRLYSVFEKTLKSDSQLVRVYIDSFCWIDTWNAGQLQLTAWRFVCQGCKTSTHKQGITFLDTFLCTKSLDRQSLFCCFFFFGGGGRLGVGKEMLTRNGNLTSFVSVPDSGVRRLNGRYRKRPFDVMISGVSESSRQHVGQCKVSLNRFCWKHKYYQGPNV